MPPIPLYHLDLDTGGGGEAFVDVFVCLENVCTASPGNLPKALWDNWLTVPGRGAVRVGLSSNTPRPLLTGTAKGPPKQAVVFCFKYVFPSTVGGIKDH